MVEDFATCIFRASTLGRVKNVHPTVYQRTLFNVTWWPGWEGSLGENGYLNVYVSPAFPSTSSISSASATLETARSTSPCPLPPHTIQCEDNKDEGLYDDPVSLNE